MLVHNLHYWAGCEENDLLPNISAIFLPYRMNLVEDDSNNQVCEYQLLTVTTKR